MLTILTLTFISMTNNDILMTDVPLNWKDLKKKGRAGQLMPNLRMLTIGKAIEVNSYGTARVYASKLNNEFKDRNYEHYPLNGTYFIGRTS